MTRPSQNMTPISVTVVGRDLLPVRPEFRPTLERLMRVSRIFIFSMT